MNLFDRTRKLVYAQFSTALGGVPLIFDGQPEPKGVEAWSRLTVLSGSIERAVLGGASDTRGEGYVALQTFQKLNTGHAMQLAAGDAFASALAHRNFTEAGTPPLYLNFAEVTEVPVGPRDPWSQKNFLARFTRRTY